MGDTLAPSSLINVNISRSFPEPISNVFSSDEPSSNLTPVESPSLIVKVAF